MKEVLWNVLTESLPTYSWVGEGVDDKTFEQVKNLSNLPFLFKHVALMPDAHLGYGMPIGGVIATSGVVVPNAVGVDIGCGMSAIQTSLEHLDKYNVLRILDGIRARVPMGFKKHVAPKPPEWMPDISRGEMPVVKREFLNACKSLGTLGGGNHFIEIQQGSDNKIWFMVHSGSRNLGKQVADYYNKVAEASNEKWFSAVPKEAQLAFLPLDSEEGQLYMREMQYCIDFAYANRDTILDNVVKALKCEMGRDVLVNRHINIAHNYAAMENHFGRNVLVHRKGAIRAREGEVGIIPSSQGTPSHIVEGLGERNSFTSSSHGAGRKMGRNQAKKELDLDEEQKKLIDKGIIHSVRCISNLDEASGAYKDIDAVMESQKDLTKITETLQPLAVLKG